MSKFLVCEKGVLGAFTETPFGWRFISWTQNGTSRKHCATPDAAIPAMLKKRGKVIDAKDGKHAAAIAANLSGDLAGKICTMSHAHPYNSPEAIALVEAATRLREIEKGAE